jgi:hypothetical protein
MAWADEAPVLAGLAAASVQGVVALGARPGARVSRWCGARGSIWFCITVCWGARGLAPGGGVRDVANHESARAGYDDAGAGRDDGIVGGAPEGLSMGGADAAELRVRCTDVPGLRPPRCSGPPRARSRGGGRFRLVALIHGGPVSVGFCSISVYPPRCPSHNRRVRLRSSARSALPDSIAKVSSCTALIHDVGRLARSTALAGVVCDPRRRRQQGEGESAGTFAEQDPGGNLHCRSGGEDRREAAGSHKGIFRSPPR